ncbi:hypothetical protein DKX38_026964 [Salix brachista]|uniref:Uncharacterized protein n=1 Tax=Salix brachista TaxID=2182728 RepID=A0A5N5JCM4_9ROSI|nr:hypothetical protein DKX38_026964 [Salix brachista]
MEASSNRRGGSSYGGAAPCRSRCFLSFNLGFMSPLFNSFLSFSNVCREGPSTRPVASSDEIQLRIDPIHGDVDAEVIGHRSQVRQRRNVSSSLILRNESKISLRVLISRF